MALRGFRIGGTVILGIIMALFGLYQYYSKSSVNEITKETQRINMSVKDEIALGLASKPQMINEFGGLYDDEKLQNTVKQVGQRVVQFSTAKKSPYKYEFHLLGDRTTINAFALPGGQVFITYALLSKLKTEGQLAGVLGHEIGHVVARHSAERIAEMELTQSLTGAAVVASGSEAAARLAMVIGNLVNMKYGREQELQSDDLGVRFMLESGYDPSGMVDVMKVLEAASHGKRQAEFASTHPSPENRIAKINEAIKKYKPLEGSKGNKELPEEN